MDSPGTDGALGPHKPRLHKFCSGERAVDLCSFDIPEFSHSHGHGLPTWRGDDKGTDCLNLSALVTDNTILCNNWLRAFDLLHDKSIPLVKFLVVGSSPHAAGRNKKGLPRGIPGVPDSFPLVAKWSTPPYGSHWIINEFYGDQYQLQKLSMPAGECFIDIGANVGMFSLIVPRIFNHVHGFCFEAQPLNFLLLHNNLAENGLLDSVTAINAALNSNVEPVAIPFDRLNPGGNIVNYKAHGDEAAAWAKKQSLRFMTPSLTMSQALKMCSATEQVTMKLDCEGCEYAVWPDVYANAHRFRMMRGEVHKSVAHLFDDGKTTLENMTEFFTSKSGGWVHR